MKRHFFEAVTLVVLAALCAITSNALASRERKMALAGYYPSATKVPPTTTEEPKPIAPGVQAAAQPAAQPAATTTVAPQPTQPAPQPAPQPVPQPAAQPRSRAAAPPIPAAASSNPVTRQPSNALAATFKPHPDKPYLEIPYSDVAALHDAGVLFLDARRTSIYETGHIAGARPFSVWESDIDEKVKKLYDERQDKQADPIVVYCSGGDCEDSHMLAQKLWGVLFNNVYVYKDGFPDWQRHGGAVHTGATP